MNQILFRRGTLWAALFAASTTFAGVALAAPSDSLLSSSEVRSLLAHKGYTAITDLDFDHGVWEADATNAQGMRVDVHVDPRSGQILSDAPPRMLGASEIRDRLAAGGYKRIRDLEFDDGVWKAEAFSAKGMPVDVTLDPQTGKILHVENDLFD